MASGIYKRLACELSDDYPAYTHRVADVPATDTLSTLGKSIPHVATNEGMRFSALHASLPYWQNKTLGSMLRASGNRRTSALYTLVSVICLKVKTCRHCGKGNQVLICPAIATVLPKLGCSAFHFRCKPQALLQFMELLVKLR